MMKRECVQNKDLIHNCMPLLGIADSGVGLSLMIDSSLMPVYLGNRIKVVVQQ